MQGGGGRQAAREGVGVSRITGRRARRRAGDSKGGRAGKRFGGKCDAGMRMHRWIFCILWVLSLAGITCFGGAVSYGFFFGMTLLPVISLIYIACVYSRFKIYQEIGSRSMVCGQSVPYFFVLQNEDFFAYTSVGVRLFSDFSYVEELPGDTEYELLPGEKFTFRTRLVCRYRGEYEVGVKEVVVTDFLRLIRVRYLNPGTVKAIVRPRVVQLTQLKSIGDLQTLLQREVRAETEPDVLVRDYMEGDAPGQIHWKATAREGRLKTRLRTGEENQGIAVFCDVKRCSRKREEYLPLENKILETLLALGFYLAGREIPFSLHCGQKRPVVQQVRGMKDFDAFYGRTADLCFDENEFFRIDPQTNGAALWNCKMIFMVLHELDDRLMEEAAALAAQGKAVVLYVVTDDDLEAYMRQSSGRRRIVQVPVEAELEGVL